MVEKEMVPCVFAFDSDESGSDRDEADLSYTEESNDTDNDDIASSVPSENDDSNEDLVYETSDISNKDVECQNDSEEESFNSISIKIDMAFHHPCL